MANIWHRLSNQCGERYFAVYMKYVRDLHTHNIQGWNSNLGAIIRPMKRSGKNIYKLHPMNHLRDISRTNRWSYTHHDDLIKWKHFHRYWLFVRGIHLSRWIPRTKASDAEMFSLICASINACVNNREASDLRRHRAHYDVIVLYYFFIKLFPIKSNLIHSFVLHRNMTVPILVWCGLLLKSTPYCSDVFIRWWPSSHLCHWCISLFN